MNNDFKLLSDKQCFTSYSENYCYICTGHECSKANPIFSSC